VIVKEAASGNGLRRALAYLDRKKHTIGFVTSRNLAHEDLCGVAREM